MKIETNKKDNEKKKITQLTIVLEKIKGGRRFKPELNKKEKDQRTPHFNRIN